MSIDQTGEKYIALIDSVTEMPLPMPTFGSDTEVGAFMVWQDGCIGISSEGEEVTWSDLRHLSPSQLAAVRLVWSRVWAGMEANPDHEHTPGCDYQQRCSDCDWESNWGDGDNAFFRGWDHSHDDHATRGHRTTTVHK